MDSDFLRSLILVVEKGSIAAAARSENMTPAAIGQRIAALEAELGCALLTRVGRKAQPTQACLSLLPRARNIIREIDQLAGDTDDTGLSGNLRLGVISTAMSSYLPAALRQLRVDAPDLHLTITPGTSRMLYDATLAGELDAAILVDPPFILPKSLQMERICSEPLCFMSAKQYPVSNLRDIRALIKSQLFIRYDPQSWGGQLAQIWADDNELDLNLLCDLDGPETIAQMVSERMGVSLLPIWPSLHNLTLVAELNNLIHIYPIDDATYARKIGLLSLRQSQRQKMISVLFDCLQPDNVRFPVSHDRDAAGSNIRLQT